MNLFILLKTLSIIFIMIISYYFVLKHIKNTRFKIISTIFLSLLLTNIFFLADIMKALK